MRILLCVLAILSMSISVLSFADQPPVGFDDPGLAARYEKLIHELRCPKCGNESLASANVPIAADIRSYTGTLLKSGESDDQIRQQLVQRFGEDVLYKPRIESRTWSLWGLPGLAILLGILIIGLLVIRRRRHRVTELDDSERERLTELLKRHAHKDNNKKSP